MYIHISQIEKMMKNETNIEVNEFKFQNSKRFKTKEEYCVVIAYISNDIVQSILSTYI